MARRVAMARAIALDPELVMYDEPFAGLDPISLGTAAQLIRELNDTMGLTSLFVSHEIWSRLCDCRPGDHSGQRPGIAAQGTPDEVRHSTDPLVYQYVNACLKGRCGFITRVPVW
jgi:phospholipid/cholesterol/gamma-HCH transport system ATP-binding protein